MTIGFEPPKEEPREYVVVLSGTSHVRIRPGQQFIVRSLPKQDGTVDMIFRTHHADEGFESLVPRAIWVEARTRATSMKVAIERCWRAAVSFAPNFAFTTNAHIADVEPEVAFDATPGVEEREYFQNFVPSRTGFFGPLRFADLHTTDAFLNALQKAPPERQSAARNAIVQYSQALRHWRPGHESIALAHLFMGVEAIKSQVLSAHLVKTGLAPSDLAARWGVKTSQLEGEARLRLIFERDDATHAAAKRASDGFEHGSLSFEEIRSSATAARDATAAYLRRAVVRLAGLDEQNAKTLLSGRYERPVALGPYSRQFHAVLVGKDESALAAPGRLYPYMAWQSKLKEVKEDAAGEFAMSFSDTFSLSLGPDVELRPRGYAIWSPTGPKADLQPQDVFLSVSTDAARADLPEPKERAVPPH